MAKKSRIVVVFVIATLLLALMMPKSGFFKYKYLLGQPWSYETLVAPFDFPVLKTDAELKADADHFNETFVPIYRRDTTAASRALKMFAGDYSKESNVYETLYKIYATGVISQSSYNNSLQDAIRLIDNSTISELSHKNLYTPEEAQALLRDAIVNSQYSENNNLRSESNKYIVENIIFDQPLTQTAINQEKSRLSISKGFITKGTIVITEDEMVDEGLFNTLESFKTEFINANGGSSYLSILLGNILYVAIVMGLSLVFLLYFRKEFSQNFGYVLFMLFIYLFMMSITIIVNSIDGLNLYIIPFAVVPFYIVTFYDIRMSIFEYVSIMMICAAATTAPFETFFINLFAGLSGIFVLQNAYHRTRIFTATGAVLIVYILSFIAISLVEEPDISLIKWSTLPWFVANVVLLLALYQLIYLFEKIFKFVTNITLFELCDTNQSLLRELAEKAPGTFQHSMQVAGLAEEAAKAIGANALLARTGALYHDIGKSLNPAYFIENQSESYSPHDSLEPEQSAEVIMHHISDGVRLAKKHNLPSKIIDFISTHHGDSKIYYFYHLYQQKHGEAPDPSLFCYTGPTPVSKESSICMMADAIEAASRSLKEFDAKSIEAMVDKIVDTQIAEGQFAHSLLSFSEITTIKEVMKSKIINIHHTRIEYPEREK